MIDLGGVLLVTTPTGCDITVNFQSATFSNAISTQVAKWNYWGLLRIDTKCGMHMDMPYLLLASGRGHELRL